MVYYCKKKEKNLHNILECIGCRYLLYFNGYEYEYRERRQ